MMKRVGKQPSLGYQGGDPANVAEDVSNSGLISISEGGRGTGIGKGEESESERRESGCEDLRISPRIHLS